MNGKKWIKRITALTVGICLLLSSALSGGLIGRADESRDGYINGTDVRLRSGPGTEYSRIGVLNYPESLRITGQETGSDHMVWYQVTVVSDGRSGYVRSDLVTLVEKEPSQAGLYGTVNANSVNVRSAPGTWNSRVTVVQQGQSVKILASENDSDGDKWYKVSFTMNGTDYEGYIFYSVITVEYRYEYDENFEAMMNREKFPENYKDSLRRMHAEYPNWIVRADHLGLDWKTAVDDEMAPGKNVVSPSRPEAWRSMENGNYDFDTKEYATYDSGSWLSADRRVVEYYMDPRNFLTGNSVCQFVDMNYDASVQNIDRLRSMLVGTFLANDLPEGEPYGSYAQAIMAAAGQSGVSPYSLASMILVEQGTAGQGKCISGVQPGYEGYYNFYNIGAYAANGYSAVANGLRYAMRESSYGRPWNSRSKAIIGGAEFYADNYLKDGQDTLYYKKFDVVSGSVGNHQYMTNVEGADSEARVSSRGMISAWNTPVVLSIPVYDNMPDTVSPYPYSSGNNDCYLTGISVAGNALPVSRMTDSYEIIVENDVTDASVWVTLSDSDASVSGDGSRPLSVGNNRLDITVTASSGKQKVYTVSVYRKEGPPEPAEPTLSSSHYRIGEDGRIAGIDPLTSPEVLIANLQAENGRVEVENPGEKIATGQKLFLKGNDGSVAATYTLCVQGDLNGDGRCSLVDMARVQRHLLEINQLEGDAFAAADFNGDGRISVLDMARIQRYLLGL